MRYGEHIPECVLIRSVANNHSCHDTIRCFERNEPESAFRALAIETKV